MAWLRGTGWGATGNTESKPVTEQIVETRATISGFQEHKWGTCFIRRGEGKTNKQTKNNTETNYEGVRQSHSGPAHVLLWDVAIQPSGLSWTLHIFWSQYPAAAPSYCYLAAAVSEPTEIGVRDPSCEGGRAMGENKKEDWEWGESWAWFSAGGYIFSFIFFRLARVFFVLNNGDNYTFKGSHSKPPKWLRNLIAGNHEKM